MAKLERNLYEVGTKTSEKTKYKRQVNLPADSLASQDDGENLVTEIMGWEQRIWTENVLFGPWGTSILSRMTIGCSHFAWGACKKAKKLPMFEKVCFSNMGTFFDDFFDIFKKVPQAKWMYLKVLSI